MVVALGFLVWQQRQTVENKLHDNACSDWTFFGIHVDKPDDVVKRCQAVVPRPRRRPCR